MKAKILDGRKIAQGILEDLKKNAPAQKITLAIIQVGDNRVSETYIKEKQKVGATVGVTIQVFRFPATITQKKLEQEVERIGKDERVTGLLVQLPLPKHVDMQRVLDYIPAKKDVDVLSSLAFDEFTQGKFSLLPPTVAAVKALFSAYEIPIKGKEVVVVGSGRLVGLPLIAWLQNEGVVARVANKDTKDLPSLTQRADIIISGVGKKGLVKGDMVKKGVVVVDAGTSVAEGKTMGDIDFESVSQKASYISPVPGGVGPVTVACLFQNLVLLAKR